MRPLRLPFTLQRIGRLEVKCCGKWLRYPRPNMPTTCPTCGTMFSIEISNQER